MNKNYPELISVPVHPFKMTYILCPVTPRRKIFMVCWSSIRNYRIYTECAHSYACAAAASASCPVKVSPLNGGTRRNRNKSYRTNKFQSQGKKNSSAESTLSKSSPGRLDMNIATGSLSELGIAWWLVLDWYYLHFVVVSFFLRILMQFCGDSPLVRRHKRKLRDNPTQKILSKLLIKRGRRSRRMMP